MSRKTTSAPVRVGVVLAALAAIVLLAVGVCALHAFNAVATHGEIDVIADRLTDGAQDNLTAVVEEPRIEEGILHISGMLLRREQETGVVNVRVALQAQPLDESGMAQDKALLLHTQMVRRSDTAKTYGVDDHCGFHAAVKEQALLEEGWQYRVLLVDESGEEQRIITTDLWISRLDGGLAFIRRNAAQQEGNTDD